MTNTPIEIMQELIEESRNENLSWSFQEIISNKIQIAIQCFENELRFITKFQKEYSILILSDFEDRRKQLVKAIQMGKECIE